nr:GNAT family N-acetyltransferase [uncultured Flavobacterium sp.]
MTIFKRTHSEDPDFKNLVVLLDRHLAFLDGDDHEFYAQFDTLDNIKNVVVCYQEDVAVGCGAFKEYDANTVEIKRMFVHPDFRGKGTASAVLHALEHWATELNYTSFILETGKNNPEAIALYHKSGFAIIPNYDQYENLATSVCMKKSTL